MYIHIGSSMAVRDSSVIGIFDLDNTTIEKSTRGCLEALQRDGMLIDVSDDVPKAFVLSSEYGITRAYLTQLSAATIEKRSEKGFEF